MGGGDDTSHESRLSPTWRRERQPGTKCFQYATSIKRLDVLHRVASQMLYHLLLMNRSSLDTCHSLPDPSSHYPSRISPLRHACHYFYGAVRCIRYTVHRIRTTFPDAVKGPRGLGSSAAGRRCRSGPLPAARAIRPPASLHGNVRWLADGFGADAYGADGPRGGRHGG